MIGRNNIGRIALAGALAVMVAACGGGGSGSPAPAAASTGASAAQATEQAGGAPGNIISALSDLSSYKVKLVLASKGSSGMLGSLGNITMEGTVVLKPAKASDITMMGMRIVEVNGKEYTDLGSGLTESTGTSSSSLADSLSAEKLLGGMSSYVSQMKSVGDEQKNGILATHYQADEKLLGVASSSLSMFLTGAKWSWDVWIAKEGGYAVSYALQGTGASDSSFTMSFDVSDVNSPTNVVKGP